MQQMKLPEAWRDVLQLYEPVAKIGSGRYGQVYKAECLKKGRTVAIKYIHMEGGFDYEYVKLIREIQILKNAPKLSVGNKCCFIPELYDVIIPQNEQKTR